MQKVRLRTELNTIEEPRQTIDGDHMSDNLRKKGNAQKDGTQLVGWAEKEGVVARVHHNVGLEYWCLQIMESRVT